MPAFRRLVSAAALSAAAASLCIPPAALAAGGAEATPRQLVSQYSCGQARAVESDMKRAGALSPDARAEVEIVWSKCAAEQHNKEHPDQPLVVLVTPDPAGMATTDKIFRVTASPADERLVREFCAKAGGGAATVAAEGGPVACEAFVRAAKPENPLIVLAPAKVGGSAVTTRLLAMIGDDEADKRIAAEAGRVQGAVGSPKGPGAIMAEPIVMVSADTAEGALGGGTRSQFFHAAKCVTSMGLRSGCDKK